jgi:hypothetical protein
MFVRHRWPQSFPWWLFGRLPRENAAGDYKRGHRRKKQPKLNLLHRGVSAAMTATPKDRQRIIELVNAGTADKSPIEATARAIHRELPHLTAAEVADVCRVHGEEMRMDAAVLKAEAEASHFIGNTLRAAGYANLGEAFKALALRAERGDQDAAELLEQLDQASTLIGDWIQVR